VSTSSLLLGAVLWVVGAARLVAQGQPFSVLDVQQLIESGVSDVRVVQLARRDCLLFKLDAATERRLEAIEGVTAVLIRGLRTACYAGAALEVTSEPEGLEVWLGARHVGTTPWSSEIARGTLTVAVVRGEWRDSVVTRLPVGHLVRVHFLGPADTLAWPVEPTRERLAAAFDRSIDFTPSRAEPTAPETVTAKRPKGRQIFGAVVGVMGGGVLGYAVDPHSDSVASNVAVGGVLVGALGWWVGKKLDDASYNARVRDHDRRVAEYQATVAAWQAQMDSERAVMLGRLVDSAVAVEHVRADSFQAAVRVENRRILARNRAAPAPTVTVERLP
jgi:hypothetical protein